MSNYSLKPTTDFDRRLKKYLRSNKSIYKTVGDTLKALKESPFQPSLKTHKVNSKNYGVRYSSRLSGDLRIIWDFDKNKRQIILLAIGSHSGKKSVY